MEIIVRRKNCEQRVRRKIDKVKRTSFQID